MQRYFFDFREGSREHVDADGTTLGSVEEARREAIETLCEMAKEAAPRDQHRYELTIAVRDADGTPLLQVGLTCDTGAEPPPG